MFWLDFFLWKKGGSGLEKLWKELSYPKKTDSMEIRKILLPE